MSRFSFSDGVAVAELVFYPVALIIGVFLCCKHGLTKKAGWILLCIFSILRIIGAASTLALITTQNSAVETLAIVATLLGLAPLLLATLGIVNRIYYSLLEGASALLFTMRAMRVLGILATAGAILSIVGATTTDNIADVTQQITVRVAVIIYSFLFIIFLLLTAGAMARRARTGRSEGKLITAMALSLPFLSLRIVYSLIECFGNDPDFSPVSDKAWISLLMATLPEATVVTIFLVAGIASPAIPLTVQFDAEGNEMDTSEKLAYRSARGDFGKGKLRSMGISVAGLNSDRGAAESQRRNEEVMAKNGRYERRNRH